MSESTLLGVLRTPPEFWRDQSAIDCTERYIRCVEAANHIEHQSRELNALRARVSELEAAGRAVLNCNDQVCAFGHGGCPAQCRADEMLRKAIRCAGNKPPQRKEGE